MGRITTPAPSSLQEDVRAVRVLEEVRTCPRSTALLLLLVDVVFSYSVFIRKKHNKNSQKSNGLEIHDMVM